MFTLIIGGAASGKSRYAEAHVQRLPGNKVYIATMQPFDDECRLRIAKHRAGRAHLGFRTIEKYTCVADAGVAPGDNVLLECISNLLANEMYSPGGGGAEAVLYGIEALLKKCGSLTVVTNEVFSGGDSYEGDTVFYLKELARINRVLASRADFVAEIVCSLPNVLKGEALYDGA